MISKCTVLIATLSLAVGFTLRDQVTRTRRDAPYRGPPAPLNQDGTVAFTSEFHQANDVHNAAYVEEYQRLQAAEDLAVAHPDRTSPPSKDYNPQDNIQYNSHDNRQLAPQQEDDGQYRPHLYESNQQYSSPVQSHQPQVSYNQGAAQQYYNPSAYKTDHYTPTTQHNQQQYSPAPQNPLTHVAAPLNPDGTVAHTPEYLALAASLHNSHQQTQTRHRRSLNLFHSQPAPLNHDGTVANTPEIEHAIAAHKAAYAQEYQKLQSAALHNGGYCHQQYEEDDGQYKPHLYDNDEYQEDLHHTHNLYSTNYYNPEPSYNLNPEANIPAPLNHDGTVAHTAEYKALAAAHQAEYAKALHSALLEPQHSSYSRSNW